MSDFYVHIIESPSPKDLQAGRTEGTLISEFLKLAGIQSEYDLTVSYDEFMKSIQNRMAKATGQYKKYPILHISAHGDKDRLLLTDNTPINWDDFKKILLPINTILKNQFVVCLSTCQGFSAGKMAMGINGKIPFGALVGPLNDIPWDESAIAFMVFYNRLSKDKDAYKAVDAMNAASGRENFGTITGIGAQKFFRRKLEEIQFQNLQQQLQNVKPNKQ